MMRRKKRRTGLLAGLLLPLFFVAAAVCFAVALDSLDRGREEETHRRLEETLRKGCVACYAAEGFYPPDLDYLTSHYGVQIDERRYVVKYMALGENLMPDITVLEKAS